MPPCHIQELYNMQPSIKETGSIPMTKTNPIGRNKIDPMSEEVYTDRRLQLLGLTAVPQSSKEVRKPFAKQFIPLLTGINPELEIHQFDNTTFYHYELPEDMSRDSYPLDALTRLPFEDIALVVTGGVFGYQKGVIKFHIRSKTEFSLGIFIPMRDVYRSPITYIYNLSTNHRDSYRDQYFAKNKPDGKHFDEDVLASFENLMVAVVTNFLETYEAYEPTYVESKSSRPPIKGKKSEEIKSSGIIEYILDLSKPRVTKDESSKGTHARPCEHIRRPHKRTLRNGKVIWIKQRVINKGLGKTVKKDYKV